ncbi:MAG: hypothetical protein AB7C92_02980 [Synergistaceae bacterium]
MIKLLTTFNDHPAPGGLFDVNTRTYIKACHNQNGGKHPHKPDLGGIDNIILNNLRNMRCKVIQLELPDGTFRISFQDFLDHAYSIKWNDPRFKYARWYCPMQYWESDNPTKPEESTARESEQGSLFGASELQDLAMSGRWN